METRRALPKARSPLRACFAQTHTPLWGHFTRLAVPTRPAVPTRLAAPTRPAAPTRLADPAGLLCAGLRCAGLLCVPPHPPVGTLRFPTPLSHREDVVFTRGITRCFHAMLHRFHAVSTGEGCGETKCPHDWARFAPSMGALRAPIPPSEGEEANSHDLCGRGGVGFAEGDSVPPQCGTRRFHTVFTKYWVRFAPSPMKGVWGRKVPPQQCTRAQSERRQCRRGDDEPVCAVKYNWQ